MARKKWARMYGATAGCNLRLLDALQLSELGFQNPNRQCVYTDSWFASFKTAMALSDELGLYFTGPIKTAYEGFPIEQMRASYPCNNATRGAHGFGMSR
jgi:hypothetical protein